MKNIILDKAIVESVSQSFEQRLLKEQTPIPPQQPVKIGFGKKLKYFVSLIIQNIKNLKLPLSSKEKPLNKKALYTEAVKRLKHRMQRDDSMIDSLFVQQPDKSALIYLAIRHLRRGLSPVQTKTLMKNLMMHSLWSSMDIQRRGIDLLLGDAKVSDESYLDSSKQYIFCSGHLGPHQLAPIILAKLGYKMCIVIAGEFIDECQIMNQNCESVCDEYGWPCEMVLLSASDPMVVKKMLRYKNDGYSLFLYFDGNAGVGGVTRRDDKLISLPFLDANIMVRKGLDSIARMTKLPVALLECKRESIVQRTLIIEAAITPELLNRESKKDKLFLTKKAYQYVQERVAKEPYNWDSFLHCYYWLKPEDINSDDYQQGKYIIKQSDNSAKFDDTIFDILNYSDGQYLVNINDLNHYKLPASP